MKRKNPKTSKPPKPLKPPKQPKHTEHPDPDPNNGQEIGELLDQLPWDFGASW